MSPDWGMNATLELTHRGRLRIQPAHGALTDDSPSPEQQAQLREMLADKDAIWLGHANGHEDFPAVNTHLQRFAAMAGYDREPIQTIADSNGRPIFEIFRFRPRA